MNLIPKQVVFATMLVGLILLAGCTGISIKRVTDPLQTAFDGRVVFTAPIDWVRYDDSKQSVSLTRDSRVIQFITIDLGESEKLLSLTKPKVDATRLPKEIGELVLAEFRASLGSSPLAVKEISPANVGGKPGFRAHASFRNSRGAPYDMVIAGALADHSLMIVVYQALSVHFYERDLPAYEALLKSLRLN